MTPALAWHIHDMPPADEIQPATRRPSVDAHAAATAAAGPSGEMLARRPSSHKHGGPMELKTQSFSSSELEIVRQYSETSARVSAYLSNKKDHKSSKANQAALEDLKKELEMWEHKVSADELCKRLGTDPKHGLSADYARECLQRDGPNRLNPPKSTPWWVKLGWHFLNFFAILLQIASILCFIGYALDRSSKTNLFLGIVLYLVVIFTAVFSFLQDHKADKLMEKLQNFLPPKAVVIRNGRSIAIDASELVVGDVVEVKLGDKIPADVRLIVNDKLKVDNSSLTGESEPVGRTVACTDKNPRETRTLRSIGL